jgi:hypothetical protein
MLVRRKIMLASLAGALVPLFSLCAQPGPPPDRDRGEPPPDRDHGAPPVDHDTHRDNRPAPRPRTPAPRHEDRPPPPGREGWHWRDGHWAWAGNRWEWVSGRWYH